jgi:hypothetical protein
VILLLGSMGRLPRVGTSTKGEGRERRYFYGSVWAVTVAQALLLVLWQVMPQTRATSLIKLMVYVGALWVMWLAARGGLLPRTRPILPGEFMVAE